MKKYEEAYWRKILSDEIINAINSGSEINAYGAYLLIKNKGETKMNDKEYENIFQEGYRKGRTDAAEAVRAACSVLGGDAGLYIHFITAAAEEG